MGAESISWVRDVGLVSWLAKDLGWVLLVPALAWPAALVAVGTEGHLAFSEWDRTSAGIRVHSLAELSWLVGNCVWMSCELLFDKKPRSFLPWYSGAVLEDDAKAYNIGADISLVILCSGFLLLMGYYIHRIREHVSGRGDSRGILAGNPQDDTYSPVQETLVFDIIPEEIYMRMFLFPWIAKDICWNLEWMYPLVFFALLVVGIAVDYVRRYGGPHFWAELCWFCGNAVWAWSELGVMGTGTNWRVCAAVLLGMGILRVLIPAHFMTNFANLRLSKVALPPRASYQEGQVERARERQPLMIPGGTGSSGTLQRI